MDFEVIVVGAGIGGLVTAALLAARGVNVGLLERQPRVGGCLANVEHLGFQFEPTYGLYSGWEPNGIFDRIFSELPIESPSVAPLSPSYVVRLPDGIDVAISNDAAEFRENLRRAFPECTQGAIDFYRWLAKGETADEKTTIDHSLQGCSPRFRRFIDIQLETFAQCSSDECSYAQATAVLDSRRPFWQIAGGAQSLVDRLARSFEKSGGTLRLNAPVLRLAYGSDGIPTGVDLLNGERLTARAIVSNLTIWDTYGKLVGRTHTPSAVASQLKTLHAWGAYLLFASLDQSTAKSLPPSPILALTDWQEGELFDPSQAQFVFSPVRQAQTTDQKLTVTVSTFTHAEEWFSFHERHDDFESLDHFTLEGLWTRLHKAMPELGAGIEVIETSTPQTFYETHRRRFGMIGGIAGNSEPLSTASPFPNLHLVGDTIAGHGVDRVSGLAYQLANQLTS